MDLSPGTVTVPDKGPDWENWVRMVMMIVVFDSGALLWQGARHSPGFARLI